MKNTKLLAAVLGACVTAGVVSVIAGKSLRTPTSDPTQSTTTRQDSMSGNMMANEQAVGSMHTEKMAMEPSMMPAPKMSTGNDMKDEAKMADGNIMSATKNASGKLMNDKMADDNAKKM